MGKSDLGAKPSLSGNKPALSKEPPTKGSASRNLLSLEDVADRLRVDARHVEIWIKDGILKGSVQGIQLYELEKFRAKHHRDIQQAQHAPPPGPAKASKAHKSQGKKPAASTKEPAAAKEKTPGPNPFSLVAAAIKSVVSATLGLNRPPKPAKVAPYVRPAESEDDDPFLNAPTSHPTMVQRPPTPEAEPLFSASAMVTANIPAGAFQAAVTTGELSPPAPPSSEVWPSLEGTIPDPGKTPPWLTTSVEQPAAQHETLIMRADQIMAQMKGAPASQPPAPAGAANTNAARELQEEKQRNQQLLLQLQDQRRAELEIQDEVETLKQRLELSLTSEREVRSQLKRSRQELQTALEELEQRPPAGGADPEALRQLQEREIQWASEKTVLEQQRAQLDQRRTLLEQQIERLRTQAEEIRQHGLQWHQLATQQDQQLRNLRQQHAELEQEAGKALGELEKKVREAEAQKARAETAAEQSLARLSQLEEMTKNTETGGLQQELKNRERTIIQLQQTHDQMQARLTMLEGQQRTQVQRWEQELQASASWVQKLTEAVAVRDRRIQELEAQVAQSTTRPQSVGEEELKSQVMSLRVELTSLRRNYEIVSLQAKNLENQLQESRRTQPSTPQPAVTPAAAPVLSLEIPGTALAAPPGGSGEEEGGFRRRLKQRLGTLGPSFEEDSKKRGLEPPPFLELDIPES
ncbi:MAG: hypothetical protein KF760_01860 [Candidatus Eremiobacteraeota bacterium]|nr:hypothetical protein [Candidatus Eremiobacteraeota bacterium]MCW5872327.1 hypothetical protein [Candidatus Eremiobacteraeota bacterium]